VRDVRAVEANPFKHAKGQGYISLGPLQANGQSNAIFHGLSSTLRGGGQVAMGCVSHQSDASGWAEPRLQGFSPYELVINELVGRGRPDYLMEPLLETTFRQTGKNIFLLSRE